MRFVHQTCGELSVRGAVLLVMTAILPLFTCSVSSSPSSLKALSEVGAE